MHKPNIREIAFAPGYEITDTGQIFRDGEEKRIRTNDRGYKVISLKLVSGVFKSFKLHRLLAICFIGSPPEPNSIVCHKDDNPANNALENLYWGTPKSNGEDRSQNRILKKKFNSWNSRLTEAQAQHILIKCKRRGDAAAFAKEFGVTKQAVSRLITRKTWQHLQAHSH